MRQRCEPESSEAGEKRTWTRPSGASEERVERNACCRSRLGTTRAETSAPCGPHHCSRPARLHPLRAGGSLGGALGRRLWREAGGFSGHGCAAAPCCGLRRGSPQARPTSTPSSTGWLTPRRGQTESHTPRGGLEAGRRPRRSTPWCMRCSGERCCFRDSTTRSKSSCRRASASARTK